MTFHELFLKSSEKDVLYLLLDGYSRSEIAQKLDVRRDSINKRIQSLKIKLETVTIEQTLVRAICMDNELKDHAEFKAEFENENSLNSTQLTPLEKTIIIELLRGKDIKQIANDLSAETSSISALRSNLRRKLGATNEACFVIKAIALGILRFELNCIPLQEIINNKDALWEYFQEYVQNKKKSNLLYSPVFRFKNSLDVAIGPEHIQLIQLRVLGYSNEEIARMSGCTRQTISRKIQAIKFKFGLRSAGELVVWALSHELIKLNEQISGLHVPERSQYILNQIEAGKKIVEIAEELALKPASVSGSLAYLKKKWKVKTLEAVLYNWLSMTQTSMKEK